MNVYEQMREVLEYVLQFCTSDDAAMSDGLTDAERIMELSSHIDECQKRARAALALPRRQCDVGMPDDMADRYIGYCKGFTLCSGCPFLESYQCALEWSQMPYKEKGSEEWKSK